MLVKTGDHEVQGNMPGQAVDMTLSGDSLAHIMDILSDLYSDRPAAIVREYGTNAMDAHIISGQTKPIEISTPNRLNPNLVIRDYGEGMSKQVLIDTYSKYGASTKRNNNLEAGQLGLGSKSGFAYTDQFTVRSVHDGHCCELIMSRNDRGAAEMTIAFDYATGDDSGVTITIPIKSYDIDNVIEAAGKFAKFATPGTISLNGKVNEIPESWTKIAENLYSTSEVYDHTVVMGNVSYPAKIFSDVYLGYSAEKLVAFVGMGEVDFAPSREALKYTVHTNNTLRLIETYFKDSIVNQINELIDEDGSRKSKILAYKTYRTWGALFRRMQADPFRDVFGSVVLGTEHVSARLPSNIDKSSDKIHNHGGTSQTKRNFSMADLSEIVDTKFFAITDFPADRVTRDHARKIISFDKTFAGSTVRFFTGKKEALDDLFSAWHVVSWNEIKAVKLAPRPKAERKKDRDGDKYLGMMVHNRRVGYDRMLSTAGPSYYCSLTEWNSIMAKDLPREDFKLFFITPSKQGVFVRKNPHAKNLKAYVKNRRQQVHNHVQVSASIRTSLEYAESIRSSVMLYVNDVTNEDFLHKIRLAKTGAKWASLSGRYYNGGFSEYLGKHYPLIPRFNSYGNSAEYYDHAVQYINMIGEKNVNA